MKNIIELQRRTGELTDDIKDVLHAADINFQALIVQAHRLHPALPAEFTYLHSLLLSLQRLLEQRPHLHMGYLITRQIQEQEERVRRQRLADYEEKIYDQRRIISDKQGFFESLLRPKKKRLPTQTAEDFQQTRTRQREVEQRTKTDILLRELADIQALKRFIEAQERDSVINQRREKNCSLSNVNSTALSLNQQEFATEKILPIHEDRLSRENQSQHSRTNSLQHSIVKESSKEGEDEREESNLSLILADLCTFRTENEQLHHIYDQECLALKFKKTQTGKLLTEYQCLSKELAETKEKLTSLQKQQAWRYQRCFRPVTLPQRANSTPKKSF